MTVSPSYEWNNRTKPHNFWELKSFLSDKCTVEKNVRLNSWHIHRHVTMYVYIYIHIYIYYTCMCVMKYRTGLMFQKDMEFNFVRLRHQIIGWCLLPYRIPSIIQYAFQNIKFHQIPIQHALCDWHFVLFSKDTMVNAHWNIPWNKENLCSRNMLLTGCNLPYISLNKKH